MSRPQVILSQITPFNVIGVENSIVIDGANNYLQLLNDQLSPGNSYFYGTNSGGSKGWQQLLTTTLPGVTATAAEINVLHGVTSSTAEINVLTGITSTTAELNYVHGITNPFDANIPWIDGSGLSFFSGWAAGTDFKYRRTRSNTMLQFRGQVTKSSGVSTGESMFILPFTPSVDRFAPIVGNNATSPTNHLFYIKMNHTGSHCDINSADGNAITGSAPFLFYFDNVEIVL